MKIIYHFLISFLIIGNLYSDDQLYPIKSKEKWGFINKKGDVVISPDYDEVGVFIKGYGNVSINNKWGIINENNEFVIKPTYNKLSTFQEGLAVVNLVNSDDAIPGNTYGTIVEEEWGYIDKNNNFFIKPIFEEASSFVNGIARIKVHGRFKFLTRDGKYLNSESYTYAGYFSEGLAAISYDGKKYGFIDTDGNPSILPRFSKVTSFSDGASGVILNGYSGFINKQGKYIIKPQYDAFGVHTKNIYVVKSKDKWGAVNPHNKIVIDFKFYYIGGFGNGLANASIDDYKYGFINHIGKFIIPAKFHFCCPFYDNISNVTIKFDQNAFINTKGEILFTLPVGFNGRHYKKLIQIYNQDHIGYYDLIGNIIWKPTK